MSFDQLTLDSYRSGDPVTSRLAAAGAATHAATDRERAYLILCEDGPQTDYELADGFHRRGWPIAPGNTSSGKRRGQLRDEGRVEPYVVDGKVVKRRTPSGAWAIVWRAVG